MLIDVIMCQGRGIYNACTPQADRVDVSVSGCQTQRNLLANRAIVASAAVPLVFRAAPAAKFYVTLAPCKPVFPLVDAVFYMLAIIPSNISVRKRAGTRQFASRSSL